MNSGVSMALGSEGLNPVVRVLAVVGGFVIAALLTGAAAQVMAKLVSGRGIPRWPLHTVRLLAGEPAWQKVVLVLYADSPDARVSRVNDLKRWAERLQVSGGGRVQVDFDRPPGNAPLK